METIVSIEKERSQFPALENRTYFLTCSTGLIPTYIYESVNEYQRSRYMIGGDSYWNGMTTSEMMEWAKIKIAEMIGGKPQSIAFGDNSSRMLNLFVYGLDLKPGDNVLISGEAFLSTRFAWQSRQVDGIEIIEAPIKDGRVEYDKILSSINENTKVISLSFVESSTGFRYDLKKIGDLCKKKGIVFCVDGVQGLGVLPIDVEEMNIDFLVGNDYKWMMGYCGTGFAYISQTLLERLRPQGAGWMSDACRYDTSKKQLDYRNDAGRFELGYPNVAGVYGLGLAAERYNILGKKEIEKYVIGIRDYLEAKVKQKKDLSLSYDFYGNERSQIVYLNVKGRCEKLCEKLAEKKIDVSSTYIDTEKSARLRLALHYFNNEADIDKLLEAIEGR